jgi:hypothetical protein
MNAAIPVEEAYKILTDEKQNGHLVLLDAKAAFDKVIHSHLFRRMYHAGIQDKTWTIIKILNETKNHNPLPLQVKWSVPKDTSLPVSHTDLKTIGRASCPFYAAFRIVVQAQHGS